MNFLSYMDVFKIIGPAIIIAVFGSILFFAAKKRNRKYLVFAYLGILVYLFVTEAKDAAKVSINVTKTPANIIITSTDITYENLEEEGRSWDIAITFRETAGECASHGEGEGLIRDSEGVSWGMEDYPANTKIKWGPIDVEAGGTYTYRTWIKSEEGHLKNSVVEMTFTFTDAGGRVQYIPWTGHLE